MSKFTKTEKQYIKGIVQNLSLQRFTDADIVNYLHKAKGIEITKAMVNKVKNDAERQAEGSYIELKDSRYKLIAFYKDRLDSLLSYQKKLNEILINDGRSEIAVRAIAELHRIEMSIFELLTKFPEFQVSASNNGNGKVYGGCTCSTTSMDSRTHSVCRTCQTTWCHSTYSGQDWCVNPECSSGLAGNSFKPFDEHYSWVKCPDCESEQCFKKQEILDVHRHNNHPREELEDQYGRPSGKEEKGWIQCDGCKRWWKNKERLASHKDTVESEEWFAMNAEESDEEQEQLRNNINIHPNNALPNTITQPDKDLNNVISDQTDKGSINDSSEQEEEIGE